jgi:hypothetical protein
MNANYGGKTANDSAYIKQFVYGAPPILWKAFPYFDGFDAIPVIMPTSLRFDNVYIPGNLYVDGSINNPSDIHLKDNISQIDFDTTNKIDNLKASQFTFKSDSTKHVHYGFIAQDFEKEFPELISIKPDKDKSQIKSINYLEIIPLLVSKIQLMQTEIDDLKTEIKKLK